MKKLNQLLLLFAMIIGITACKNLEKPEPMVSSSPIASFTIQTGKIYQGCTVLFSNTSSNGTTYTWDFGDGQSSTDKNPTHSYDMAGNFTIKLKVVTGTESSESSIKIDIYQNQKYEKSFSLAGKVESGIVGNDGSYILLGNNNSDIVIKKINTSGIEQWTKTYDYNGLDTGEDIVATNDGGFLIVGTTQSKMVTGGDHAIYLLKIDSNGDRKWEQTFDGADREWSAAIIATKDNGFLITGFTTTKGGGGADVYLIKTDANGVFQWDKTYGLAFDEKGNDVTATIDGGYIITGYRQINTGKVLLVIKVDNNGKELWTKTYNGSEGNAIINTPDNGFFIVGSKEIMPGTSASNLYLLKIDAAGVTQWEKSYGQIETTGFDTNFADVVYQNNTYYIASSLFTAAGFGTKAYFIKVDANGNKLLEQNYGALGTNAYEFCKIFLTEDCGLIFYGTEKIGNTSSMNGFYIVKTDAAGKSK